MYNRLRMEIFRSRFIIESPLPPDQAWKKLLAVVKTGYRICTNCGQMLVTSTGAAVLFCQRCGHQAPPPIPQSGNWLSRAFATQQGYEFEGIVTSQGLQISRIINYRNSCIPTITGKFQPSPSGGTRVEIEMKMNPLGYVFLIGGAVLTFTVSGAILGSDDGKLPGFFAFVPLVVPCVIFGVCWAAFAFEADAARSALYRIWQALPQFAAP
jgi:hypothetical protein